MYDSGSRVSCVLLVCVCIAMRWVVSNSYDLCLCCVWHRVKLAAHVVRTRIRMELCLVALVAVSWMGL